MLTRVATAVARPLRRGAIVRAASSRVASVLSTSQQSAQLLSSQSETTRSFSSYQFASGGGAQSIQRAYPQYNVHGESHMLSFKLIPPSFRMVNATSMATDNKSKGRILLEFTPRGPEGQYQWSDQVRFGLSAEEVGLFLSQLPQYGIELSRNAASGAEYSGGGAVSNDMPDKVLRITPGEGAAVGFQLDYVRDGVGGQSPGIGQDGSGPMEVVAQAGEFEVIRAILQSSLSILVGWQPLVDLSIQGAVGEAMSGGGGGVGGGRYSGGGSVPF